MLCFSVFAAGRTLVEYEFQIIDGQRRLVGERKVGGTVSSQREVFLKIKLIYPAVTNFFSFKGHYENTS